MRRFAVGSRELKTRLGSYLRQVQRGRSLIVTDRGRPVAQLKPVSGTAEGEQGRLDELVALGLLTRRTRANLARIKPVRATDLSLSAAVMEAREDRL